MANFYETALPVLKQDERFVAEDGTFLRDTVYETAMKMDKELIRLLLMSDETCTRFFTEIDGVKVFDKTGFAWVINNRQFQLDSYSLKVMTDEIFRREHFVETIPRRTRNGKSDAPFNLPKDFDWLLCYTNVDSCNNVVGRSVTRKYFETDDFPGDYDFLNIGEPYTRKFKSEDVRVEILIKIYSVLRCSVDDIVEIVEDKNG